MRSMGERTISVWSVLGKALSKTPKPRPVTRDDFPRLVEIATADICHQTNPRKCAAADFEQLFAAAL